MKLDRLDNNNMVQLVASAVLTFGIAIGVCMIAYFDGGNY